MAFCSVRWRAATQAFAAADHNACGALPFADSAERNRAICGGGGSRGITLRARSQRVADETAYRANRPGLDGTEPRLRAAIFAQRETQMSIEPKLQPASTGVKLEPASRPGIKTAAVAGAIVLGIAFIVYWPQIKAAFNLG